MRHQFSPDRIAGPLGSDRGLTPDEVEDRRRQYGPNDILGDQTSGWGSIARDTARDPMIWFLVATALLFASIGQHVEAIVLALALIPIAGMDAYLHRRTQATTEGLAGRLAARARVLRDHEIEVIRSEDLVPGDIALVAAGEPFPADGLIAGGTDLQADESALTGEAMPVRKRPFRGVIGGSEMSVEDAFWGAAGTRLLTGEARLLIVFTGGETLYGQIVRLARQGRHERTPLQIAIGRLVAWLVGAALLVCLALAATRYYQGFGLLDAALSAVTLAVAAMPEEFPVAFTFFLSVGVYRLARRQALVRRSVVVENIGRATCICCDKTGTITEGSLKLVHVIPVDETSTGELQYFAAIASRAESNDPLDLAVLNQEAPREMLRIATFPFTEDRRREVNIISEGDHGFRAAAKGAPETILAMSSLSPHEKSAWLAKTAELGAAGHKVIGCATRHIKDWSGAEPDRDYEFAGLLAFADPVRAGVKEAVAKAQNAGIRVIMVTGDHVVTAAAIAKEIGLGAGEPKVIEGSDVTKLAARGELSGFDVVARAIPTHKLDLVCALQGSGEIVAVTGDGVNDVPALQGADIGIAMGERGTRPAREVASIVLLDDNFRTIVRAISEGTQLFHNLKLSFAYLLMFHIPLVVSAALVPFAGFPLLYLPMHMVWLELIVHPSALLVFQQLPTSEKLEPVQRGRKLRFFDWREWTLIVLIGSLVTLLVVLGYERSLGLNNNVEHARAMALAALVVASAAMIAGLTRLQSMSSRIAAVAAIASALVLVQIPQLAALLHLSPLHFDDWLVAAAGGAIVGYLASLFPSFRPQPP